MESKRNRSLIFTHFFFLFLIYITISYNCASAESYKFERLWPTLQQPWYFYYPNGIAIDKYGFVYVADTEKHYIQKFTADGQFVSKWGGEGREEGKFISPYGVAADRDGFIYMTDKDNYRIQKFMSDGTFSAKWDIKQDSEEGKLFPSGIAVDSNNFIYVTVANLNKRHIQKFTTNGKFLKRIEYQGIKNGEDFLFFGIAIDQEGFIYVADSENNQIQKFTPEGAPAAWKKYENENGKFELPSGIAIDKDGFVYVAGKDTDNVYNFDSNGNFIAKWGVFGSDNGKFISPTGIAVSQNGLIYVADWNNRRIQKFMSDGSFITAWQSQGSGQGELRLPEGIAVDRKNGFIYVVDTNNNRIQKFQINGQFVDEYPKKENTETFNTPYGVAVDAEGFIYVADTLNNCIKKISRDMQIVHQWGSIGISEGEFNYPLGVAIDKDGFIYVADGKNYRIQKFTSDGKFENAWGSKGNQNGEFERPTGIGIDKSGFVYVTDRDNSCIQKFTSDGQFQDKWETDWPVGIAIDDDFIYVSDSLNHCIKQFDLYGNFITRFSEFGSGAGQLNSPSYLCIVSDGRIYVSDTENNRIQVFKPVDPEAGISKAVIIAGGGPYEGNHLWDATRMNANFAYRTLNYQGFGKNDICYLSSDTQVDLDGDNKADVYGKATVENLRQAVSDISDSSENVKDLVVYLVDHGGNGYFRMNEDAEMLSAPALNTELEKLQQKISGTMIIVYDACKSGSFINSPLNPSGTEKRIIITSSLADQDAYFITQGSLSFSNLFWTHIFNGAFVQDAFNSVKDFYNNKSIKNQTPCMKDNTDGSLSVGNHTNNYWESPVIKEPSYDNKNQLLKAKVEDEDGVARVWAVIIPPQDSKFDSASKAVLELPSVDLMPVADSQYKAEYKGLNTDQPYNIMIHAIDRIGNKAVPKPVDGVPDNNLRDKAIIAADGDNADYASNVLQYQGYKEADIQKVEAKELKTAIDKISSNTNDVVIYLTGQGSYKEFKINENEKFTAADFGKQLNMLQSKIGGMIILIYDADYSGSFLPLVKPPTDKKRILISSSSASQKAYFSEGNISFSFFFWNSILQGMSVREAFVNAKKSVRFLDEKIPQIDDNGNGIGNEDADSELAENTTIGAGIRVAMNDPFVKDVSSDKTPLTDGETSATIEADISVADNTDNKVEVWATIISPGYDADWLPVQRKNPETVSLTLNKKTGKYEYTYDNFSEFGTYKVAVYIKNNDNVSLYKEIFIDQTQGADTYESGEGDDDFVHATPIVINSPSPQHHNFYEKNDVDWIKFYGHASDAWRIKISFPPYLQKKCKPDIAIYDDKESKCCNLISAQTDGYICTDRNEYFEWTFNIDKDGIYYVKIGNKIQIDTAYYIAIYIDKGSISAGLLGGSVIDPCNKIIKDAQIEFKTDDGIVVGHAKLDEDDGYRYSIFLDTGEYTATLNAQRYEIKTENIKIEAIADSGVKYLDFELEPLSRYHSADYDHNNEISLPELLRVIQIYNSNSYHCDSSGEDHYAPGDGNDRTCTHHHSDYYPQDWSINLSELLRMIQFYTIGGYQVDCAMEDGFKPKE